MILLMTTAPPEHSPWGVPAVIPPLGLAYVAAALEKAGFKVEILDNYQLKKSIDYIKSEIKRIDPEIVGMTCGSVTFQRCLETAKAVKEVKPSCKVVVGGWHPSYLSESVLEHPEIDYAIIGEGENAMVELASSLTKGDGDGVIAKIPGLACRYEGKIIKNAPKIIEDLDQVPYPARHLLPMHIYDRRIDYLSARPVDVVNVIRGCPYDCAYCETKKVWGNKCRAFSPQRIVDEVDYLVRNYGSKGIYFVGDNFTINKRHTVEVCNLIKKRKLDVEWVCDTRVDLVSRDLLKEMKSAGCKSIFFGIQSGSPRILEKLNIKFTVEQVVQTFKLLREEGINIACSFMLGIPGETIDDMKTTFKFAKDLDPDWCHFYVFIACPTSRLYEEVLQKGLYDRMEGFLAYPKTEYFDYETVLEIQRRFQKGFNLSRKRIIRKIRREGFFGVMKEGVKYGLSSLAS